MFSGLPQKNTKSARLYFDEHLSINDYYSEDQTAFGMWIGKGSQRLGMKEGSIVMRDDFVALCDNTHPATGMVATSRSLAAINRQQFYVSISRGRRQCRIFTDDVELLRNRLKKSAHRSAALELAQFAPLAEALKREGFNVKVPERPAVPAPIPETAGTTGKRIRPLRPLRYANRYVRILQVQVTQIAERFADWMAQVERQRITPKQEVRVPGQRFTP